MSPRFGVITMNRRFASHQLPLFRLPIAFAVAVYGLYVSAAITEAQVLSDHPTFFVWAPNGATVNSVIGEHEVGMDFQTNGKGGAYFRVVNDSPVDGTSGEGLILNYRLDVAVPWISFGIQDDGGKWQYYRAVDVLAGDSSVIIPLTDVAIDATAIRTYAVWVSAVDYGGTTHDLNGSFRFVLTRDDVETPPNDASIHIRAGDESSFLETMRTPNAGEPGIFYVHADAVLDEPLNIIGRNGDEVHFLEGSQVTAQVQSQGSWSDSRGVVNIVGCNDIRISGLRATNTFQYSGTTAGGDNESSTALNVSRSKDIQIDDAQLKGLGKSVVWIHGDSTVSISDATIEAYYFCVGVGASTVSFSNLTIHQFNPIFTGDKHSVFWVSSSIRSSNNQLYKNTAITLLNTTMNLRSGRAIVSGNGSYDAHSHVFFFGTTDVLATDHVLGKALGWANFHSNYHGFTIHVTGDYPLPTRDLVQPMDDGEFGRFIVNTYQGGGRPSALAPIAFCEGAENCVTSDEVLGVDQPIDLVHGGLNDEWTAINPTQLSTTPSGDLRAAYSAAYEAVILNKAIRKIDMTQAHRLRIRSRAQPQGTFRFRLSFVNEANQLLDPILFNVPGGNDWQTNTFQLSAAVRQAADKIIIGSYGNSQDVTLELAEVTILADGAP